MSGEVNSRPSAAVRKPVRAGRGSVPALAIAGGLSVALVWTLTTNDPYWRLVQSQAVPAPAFSIQTDYSAALDTSPAALGNDDQGAVSQKPELPAYAARPAMAEAFAKMDATPIVLPVPALAGEPRFAPELDPLSEVVRELTGDERSADAGAGADSAIAIAALSSPLPPIGAVLRDDGPPSDEALVRAGSLTRFEVPAAPAQPHLIATPGSEAELTLSSAQRIDVQRRLALAGFDPSGFDGVFGARTRGAIADFQSAWGFPASGYLDRSVIAELKDRTEGAYQALRRQAAGQPAAAPAMAPADTQVANADAEGGCARRSDGRIVERQSLACDIAGLSEKFAVSLGRNRLAQEDAALTAVPGPAVAAGPVVRRSDR